MPPNCTSCPFITLNNTQLLDGNLIGPTLYSRSANLGKLYMCPNFKNIYTANHSKVVSLNIRSWWRTYPLNNKTSKIISYKKLRALPKIAHKLGMCTVSLSSINLITLVDTKISAYSYITSHM